VVLLQLAASSVPSSLWAVVLGKVWSLFCHGL
jgi:hypothetical protein